MRVSKLLVASLFAATALSAQAATYVLHGPSLGPNQDCQRQIEMSSFLQSRNVPFACFAPVTE